MVDLPNFGRAPLRRRAQIAQLVERIHGKDEVTGSNPVLGSTMADKHGKEGVPRSRMRSAGKISLHKSCRASQGGGDSRYSRCRLHLVNQTYIC